MHQSLFFIFGINIDCDHDHMLLQCKDNEVSILNRALDCGMLRVEYNVRTYNIIPGMIRLT